MIIGLHFLQYKHYQVILQEFLKVQLVDKKTQTPYPPVCLGPPSPLGRKPGLNS
jgi:hypothetical protein